MYIKIAVIILILLWLTWMTIFLFFLNMKEGMTTAKTAYSNMIQKSNPGSKSPTIFSTTIGGTGDSSGNFRYDPNSYDTQYHSDISSILQQNSYYDISFNNFYVLDPSGNPVLINRTMAQANSTYQVPGSYSYVPTNYVPNYEESVFLSKSTHQPTYEKLHNTAAMQGGFCSASTNLSDAEKTCNTIDIDKCASTTCCVLLGGTKCVAGNQNGPTLKSSYSDTLIHDPTYYFFQGKCYGNCAAGV
jgi:hypothetical protein